MRLLGVSLSALGCEAEQMSLFEEKERQRKAAAMKAVDAVNEKFGEDTLVFGSAMGQEKEHRVISPAWRPSGVRKSDV